MCGEHAFVSPEFVDSVQPIVLVGGKSRRFGRDKLREPWGEPGCVLVQRPIEVLRSIFGPRVKLVGECDPNILPLADGIIADQHAGIGPMGGIVSALQHWGGPVFVLAGDMPSFAASDGWSLLHAAQQKPDCLAVLAATDRPHPCAGVYRAAALPVLSDCLARGDFRLAQAIPERATLMVPVAADSATNLNTPA
ncbi:MAG: molybdenum cofactor guanylyltransferase [Phycisphaerae bacterium]|nr:molybdenum cofactor guanylyltransferase [Phycisphaerae bacterium]